MDEKCKQSKNFSVNNKYWYAAESKLGDIYVGIDRMLNENNKINIKKYEVLEKALALSRSEELICIIEEWLDSGLFLQPATLIPTSIFTINIQNISAGQNAGLNTIILGVQYEIIEKLKKPTEKYFKNQRIETCSLEVQLVLSEFNIDKEQYELIKDGRVLLIPDSYEKDWRIKLISTKQINICRSATLSKDVRALNISDHTLDEKCIRHLNMQYNNNENESCYLSITIRNTIPIPLDYILGWKDGNKLLLDQSLRYYEVDVSSEADKIASGHLISIADGYGVYIHN
jgi:hypothetical protein